jgi:hypothetical protein
MVRVIKLGIKRPVSHGLLPDPEPRAVDYTLISVDDHLMEPPHTFEGRLPRRLQGQAPGRSSDRGAPAALRKPADRDRSRYERRLPGAGPQVPGP